MLFSPLFPSFALFCPLYPILSHSPILYQPLPASTNPCTPSHTTLPKPHPPTPTLSNKILPHSYPLPLPFVTTLSHHYSHLYYHPHPLSHTLSSPTTLSHHLLLLPSSTLSYHFLPPSSNPLPPSPILSHTLPRFLPSPTTLSHILLPFPILSCHTLYYSLPHSPITLYHPLPSSPTTLSYHSFLTPFLLPPSTILSFKSIHIYC